MSRGVDMTNWTLPGETQVPGDTLRAQLEVYGETILLRSFDDGASWVRPVSADEIAHVFTLHMGFSSGLLPDGAVWWN